MTDYAGLKAEIALPKYGRMTDTQIATSLNLPLAVAVDGDGQAARAILMRSVTYDWGRIEARARTALTGTDDELILSAISLVAGLQLGQTVLRTSQPAELAKLQSDMAALQAAGDLSQESVDAIMALTQGTTSRTKQLGFDPAIHDMTQEIAAARIWTP